MLSLKFSEGIEGVSLMGTLNELNKRGELVGGISSTLINFNEQWLEFFSNWVLLKLSLVVWEGFELSDKLDFESKLSVWILHDSVSVQMISFEGWSHKYFELLALEANGKSCFLCEKIVP